MTVSSDPNGSGDLTRRDRRKLEVHARILEAALALFDFQGVADTKVAEICDRADVAQKTFFNHFATRQHLLREIAADALDQTLERIEQAAVLPGTTPARLLHFFDGIAEAAAQAGPMHRELLTEIVHTGHESGADRDQARLLHDAFGQLVRAGIAAGDIDDRYSADTLTEMIMGAFYALMFNWAHLEGYPLRRQARAAAGFLGDAFAPAPEGSAS
jgi:AcrR family transcriptional regulator